MIKDYFVMAWKNLRKRKLRSWLTMVGIFVSIATIFLLIALSLGLQNAVQEQFRQLGTDKFFIMPKGQLGAPGTGGAVELTTKDVDVIEKVNGVKEVTYFSVGTAEVEFNRIKRYYFSAGIPLEDEKIIKIFLESSGLEIMEGKFIEKEDLNEVFIGSLYADETLFGKRIRLRETIKINGKEFRVVGFAESVGNPQDDTNIYMSIEAFKELYNSGDRIDEIFIQVEDREDTKEVAERVEKRLRSSRDVTEETQDFTVLTPEELLASFGTILNIITGFLLGISAISLLVGGIGIANTMYTSTIERTKEIGTMKAIGAQNKDILLIFLIEAGLLGLIGGIIGVFLGMGLGQIIEYIAVVQLGTNLLQVAYPWYLTVGCLAFSFGVGAVSGLLPAWQASKTNVVDALRYE